jgi:hypothetical protein
MWSHREAISSRRNAVTQAKPVRLYASSSRPELGPGPEFFPADTPLFFLAFGADLSEWCGFGWVVRTIPGADDDAA